MREIPLSAPNLNSDIVDNLKECIDSGWVSTSGRFISDFEKKIARYLKVKQAVSCQSGTAGLHTALRILGVQAGEEVIVPTLTFIAAVNPIKYLGAEPVFMDCDDTLCIDTVKLRKFCTDECEMMDGQLKNKKTGRSVKAIVPVHIFGNLCDMKSIMSIAKEFNLKVLEDATEALGSYFKDGEFKGKYAGTIGDMGVLSFNANKIITTGGGGMILSNDDNYLDQARYLTTTAKDDGLYFVHNDVGYNYRMLNLQAALGVSQIDELEKFIETKIHNYNLYKECLKDVNGIKILPFNDEIRANHWFYSLIIDNEYLEAKKHISNARDYIMKSLIEEGIQTRPVWKLSHTQRAYIDDQYYEITKAPYFEKHVLNVPCSSDLKCEDVEFISGKIINLLK